MMTAVGTNKFGWLLDSDWAIPFFSIQGCGRQFSKFILGLKNRNSRGQQQKSPLENQFYRNDPSGKLTLTSPN